MLFYLTNSLIVDSNDSEYKGILKCIRKLATSVTENKHLLMGDFEAIQFFNREFRKYDDEVSGLFNVLEHREAIYSIPTELTYYVEVVKHEAGINECTTIDGKTIAKLCYKNFEDTESCNATALVSEDDNDSAFYKFILKWYVSQVKQSQLYCNLIPVLGAGGHTPSQIQKIKGKRRTCLAIVDSDKKYPNHIPGPQSTCSKCKKIKENQIYKLLIIDAHEVENLIPINFLDNHQFSGDGVLNKQHFDGLLTSAFTETILQYFDYKNGIKRGDILNNSQYEYFAFQCYLFNKEVNKGDDFDVFLSKLEDDECYIQRPLQASIMKNILADIERLPDKECYVRPFLFTFQEDEWNRIGQHLLDWGCARNKEVIL